MFGLMRQHGRPSDIADGVDAGDIGSPEAVGLDNAALDRHAELFEPEIFDIADDADGGNHPLDRERLRRAFGVLKRGDESVRFLLDFCHFGRGKDFNPLLFKPLARISRDFRVLDGQNLRQHFDDSHLGAHGPIKGSEFDSDRARTHDDQALRKPVWDHGFEIGPDEPTVGLDARQHARPRAGRDDNVLGPIGAGPENALGDLSLRLHRRLFRGVDENLARLGDRRLAPDHIDLVLLEQKTDAAIQLARHGARALDDSGRIEADLAIDGEAIVLGVVQVMEDFRRAQQRLGRNAAPVEADAAEMLALDDSGPEAELRRANGRDIAAWSAADDEDVVRVSHGGLAIPLPSRRRENSASVANTGSRDLRRACSHQHSHRVLDQMLERRNQLRAEGAVDRAVIG